MTRDTQRKRVYDAERAASEAHSGYYFKQTIPNEQVQPWIDKVMRKAAIRKRWGDYRVTWEKSRGGGRTYGGGHIELGVGARNPWYILHEIAHCLSNRGASHGPEFVGVYRFLVRTVLGPDAAKALITAQRKHKVRSNNRSVPAPTRPVTTQSQERKVARARAARPVPRADKAAAAAAIRRLVKQGYFGPSGRKPRTHALETARALEKGHL